MYSAFKLNKQGDNIQPWRTPFPIWNQSVVPCPVLTVASWLACRFLRRQVRWSGNLLSIMLLIYYLSSISMCLSIKLKFKNVSQLCPTLCNPMFCSPPGSSVHGFLQARTLDWVAVPSSRGCSPSRDWIHVSHISSLVSRFFTSSATWEFPVIMSRHGHSEQMWGEADIMVREDAINVRWAH